MKMKLSALSGKVKVIKSDQEEARKCYENSLKTKRGVVMVIERPPASCSSAEPESMEKRMPGDDAGTKGRRLDASSMEEESEEATPDDATPMEEDPMNESRPVNAQREQPQPEDNVVENQIGGKAFKLGRHLNREE